MTSIIEHRLERHEPATRLVNLRDYEIAAREVIPRGEWDYYAGGSDDEITLRANESAFDALRLRPRVLVDVTGTTPTTSTLETPIAMPILAAPSAYQAMAHPDGELATARAAAAAGTIMIASINSNYSLEEIAEAADGPKWLQFYIYGGDFTKSVPLLRRAEAAGYGAIVLTVDRPVFGNRERDLRNDFSLPPGIRAANFDNADRKTLSVAVRDHLGDSRTAAADHRTAGDFERHPHRRGRGTRRRTRSRGDHGVKSRRPPARRCLRRDRGPARSGRSGVRSL